MRWHDGDALLIIGHHKRRQRRRSGDRSNQTTNRLPTAFYNAIGIRQLIDDRGIHSQQTGNKTTERRLFNDRLLIEHHHSHKTTNQQQHSTCTSASHSSRGRSLHGTMAILSLSCLPCLGCWFWLVCC